MVFDNQRFDVQNDIRDILKNAGNRRKLVVRTTDLKLGHRTTFQAGKQNSAKAVTNRRTEAPLERFSCELSVGTGKCLTIAIYNAW